MKRLVLDLRSNPGGQLDQAIRIANRFVPTRLDDRLHARPRRQLRSGLPRDRERRVTSTIPMIVLVNRNSASASEIVSGALQDYDRALVVGETTFGKALVQSVYRVSQGAGLALTTARYFTPSGRLIQRPWDGDVRRIPHLHAARIRRERAAHGGAVEVHDRRPQGVSAAAASSPIAASTVRSKASTRRASAARSTRGSCLPATPSSSPPKATRASAAQGKTRKVVKQGLRRRRRDGRRLQAVRDRPQVTIDEAGWTKDKDFIRAMIRYDIDVSVFDIATARQRLMAVDPQAQFALSMFPEAEKLQDPGQGQTGREVGQSSARRAGLRSPRTLSLPTISHQGQDPLNIGATFSLATTGRAC